MGFVSVSEHLFMYFSVCLSMHLSHPAPINMCVSLRTYACMQRLCMQLCIYVRERARVCVYARACMCACLFVNVCVCVREREGGKEGGREGERERETDRQTETETETERISL